MGSLQELSRAVKRVCVCGGCESLQEIICRQTAVCVCVAAGLVGGSTAGVGGWCVDRLWLCRDPWCVHKGASVGAIPCRRGTWRHAGHCCCAHRAKHVFSGLTWPPATACRPFDILREQPGPLCGPAYCDPTYIYGLILHHASCIGGAMCTYMYVGTA